MPSHTQDQYISLVNLAPVIVGMSDSLFLNRCYTSYYTYYITLIQCYLPAWINLSFLFGLRDIVPDLKPLV